MKDLLSFGANAYAGDLLSLALMWASCAIVQLLLKAGAQPDPFQSDPMEDLFAARNSEARGHGPYFCEASAKCESLIRMFPAIEHHYG